MQINEINKLDVFYNDELVGALAQTKDGKTCFQYSSSWLEKGFSISPFSLPLKPILFTSGDKQNRTGGLFGVFYDCLPDSWGNYLTDKFLFKSGVDPRSVTPFQRLALLGDHALGGLSFKPKLLNDNVVSEDELDDLASISQEIEKEGDANELGKAISSSSSVGGSRPKVNVAYNDEEWIVKYRKLGDPSNAADMEYLCNATAKEIGIKVAEPRLFSGKSGDRYFGSKRFDRQKGKRIHVISLSGLTETDPQFPMVDYLTLLEVVNILCKGDLEQAFSLACFNVAVGNKDDHGRNFAFYYDEEKKSYRLSPAFDLTQTPNIKEHALGVLWKGNPDRNDLIELGLKAGIKKNVVIAIVDKVFSTARRYGLLAQFE